MKKILILLLSLTLVFAFVSCGGSEDNPPAPSCTQHVDADTNGKCDTCGATVEIPEPDCTEHKDENGDGKCDKCGETVKSTENESTVKLIENGVANFKFVLPGTVKSDARYMIISLISDLDRIGIETSYVADNASTVSDCEILVGDVINRADEYKFDKYSLGKKGYVIKAIDNKIIINAGSDASMEEAIEVFISDVLGFESGVTEEITDLTFSSSDNIIEIQDDYAITSFTIGGKSVKGTTIAAEEGVLYQNNARTLQDTIYTYTGNYLEIVPLSEADSSSIILNRTEDDGEYGFKIYVKNGALNIDCAYDNCFADTLKEFANEKIVKATGAVDFGSDFTHNKVVRIVTYEQFGAKGDGRTDDFFAMLEAHNFANESGQTVIAKPGATYYIHNIVTDNGNGYAESIKIKTNTVWEGATIIIDDTGYRQDDKNNTTVIRVISDYDTITIDDPAVIEEMVPSKTVDKDAITKINWTYGYKAMIFFINENEKHYIRKGNYDSKGGPQRELIIVDENGNITDNTGFMFDYEDITKLEIHRVTDTPITIKGGTVITRANDQPCLSKEKPYFSRGLGVGRSNTTLDGLTHLVEGEDNRLVNGQPRHAYSGFYSVSKANNVLIQNCMFTARRYSGMAGTYDFSGGSSNNVTLYNCHQTNFYDENGVPTLDYKEFWGTGGTNYCKNLTYDTCTLSRFDAHEGLYQGKIINSTVSNLEIIGYGDLIIENTTFAVRKLPPIMLRSDYGCTWNGTLNIKDCTIDVTHKADGDKNAILGAGWYNWDFGYTCFFPNIIIDNLKWKGLPAGTTEIFVTSYVNSDNIHESTLLDGDKNINPYTPPEFIKVINDSTGYIYKVYDIPFFSKTKLEGVEFKNP